MRMNHDPKIAHDRSESCWAVYSAIASWSAAALCRFGNNPKPCESARGLAQSKTWRLFSWFTETTRAKLPDRKQRKKLKMNYVKLVAAFAKNNPGQAPHFTKILAN